MNCIVLVSLLSLLVLASAVKVTFNGRSVCCANRMFDLTINKEEDAAMGSCGATCAGDNQCTSANCSMCVANQCVEGMACFQTGCETNTDCDQSGPCRLCQSGMCVSDGQVSGRFYVYILCTLLHLQNQL